MYFTYMYLCIIHLQFYTCISTCTCTNRIVFYLICVLVYSSQISSHQFDIPFSKEKSLQTDETFTLSCKNTFVCLF